MLFRSVLKSILYICLFIPVLPLGSSEPSLFFHSAIKRNEIELFVVRWMERESVIQSEVSQKEKNKYNMLTHIYGIKKKRKMVLKNLGAEQE